MLQIRSSQAVGILDDRATEVARTAYGAWAGLAAGLALVALACAYRFAAFKVALFDWDEYAFALVARDVLDGKLPGAGVFDNKPVGLIYLFAAAEWLGGRGVLAIRTLGFCASATCGALLYRSSRTLGLGRGGALQVAAMAMLAPLCLNGFASMSELLATPLLAIANTLLVSGAAARRRRTAALLGVGAVLGLACQITYLAAPCAALTAAGVLLTHSKQRLRDAALIGAAGAAAVLAVWIPQIVAGEWTTYAAEQIRYHHSYRMAFDGRRMLAGLIMPLALMCLPPLTAWVFRASRDGGVKALPPLAWILGLQLLGAALAATASNRFYLHYLILAVPSVSALTAVLLAHTPGPVRPAGWSGLAAVLAIAAALPIVFLGPPLAGAPSMEAKAAAAVDRLTRPDQSIFVFDEGHPVYYFAGRRSVSRYVFPTHYLSSCDGAPSVVAPADAVAQALASRPALVLVGELCPPEIDAAAQVRRAGYRIVDRIEADGRTVGLFAPASGG